MKLLWTGALAILNDVHRDWKQTLPRDLNSDEHCGREHILAIMNLKVHEDGSKTLIELVDPFLQVISHSALLDCLAVDTVIGVGLSHFALFKLHVFLHLLHSILSPGYSNRKRLTPQTSQGLYNFIGGNKGSRAISFFNDVCIHLQEAHLQARGASRATTSERVFVAVATSLRELIRREQKAAFHDDLPSLVDSLERFPDIVELDKKSPSFFAVSSIIKELRGIIDHATGLQTTSKNSGRNGTGVTTVDLPNVYSQETLLPGTRHDNDKLDISEICILPTEDEVRCREVEYLPVIHPGFPHFLENGVHRHIDTFFRLYRHDTFGKLKEALGSIMLAIEKNHLLLSSPRLQIGNTRTHWFPGACIKDIIFNDRRGLEAQISFPQPPIVNRCCVSAAERSKWWIGSNRLERGVLLSYLAFDGEKCSLLFFIASEKKTGQKDGAINLSSDPHQANIVVKLASQNQEDFELMVRLCSDNISGHLVELQELCLPPSNQFFSISKICIDTVGFRFLSGFFQIELTILFQSLSESRLHCIPE